MATFRTYQSYIAGQQQPGSSQESLASSLATSMESDSATTHSVASQATNDTDMSGHAFLETKTAALQPNARGTRLHTPDAQIHASEVIESPMSIASPAGGHKRMASGQIKSPMPMSPAGSARTVTGRVNRRVSSTKASETAATLRDKLAYAMAKVQHGWEHHNIDQVEQLAAALSPRNGTSPRHAAAAAATHPRSAGLPSRNIMSQIPSYQTPFQDPQQARSAPLPQYRPSPKASMSPPRRRPSSNALAPPANLATTPPRQIRGHQRSDSTKQPGRSPARAAPTTPKGNRPGTLRTQTQTEQAEREAMSALLLMGSPSHGQFPRGARQASAEMHSPSRAKVLGPDVPRLQYRSDSNDSALSGGSGYMWRDMAPGKADVLRRREHILDEIEAES